MPSGLTDLTKAPLERIFSDVDTLADRATEHPEAITEKLDAD